MIPLDFIGEPVYTIHREHNNIFRHNHYDLLNGGLVVWHNINPPNRRIFLCYSFKSCIYFRDER